MLKLTELMSSNNTIQIRNLAAELMFLKLLKKRIAFYIQTQINMHVLQ